MLPVMPFLRRAKSGGGYVAGAPKGNGGYIFVMDSVVALPALSPSGRLGGSRTLVSEVEWLRLSSGARENVIGSATFSLKLPVGLENLEWLRLSSPGYAFPSGGYVLLFLY